MTPQGKSIEPDKGSMVHFGLWPVLAFLVILGAACVGFLNAAQYETRQKQIEVIQRVTKIETQYIAIMAILERIERTSEKVADKLDTHLVKGDRGDAGPKGDKGATGNNFWGKSK